MSDERWEVAFGALLHDIGKMAQRQHIRPPENHSEIGSQFLEELDLPDSVRDFVLNHHRPNRSSYRHMAVIVQEADHLSASERETIEEARAPNEAPLKCILSRVRLPGFPEAREAYHELRPLSADPEKAATSLPEDGQILIVKYAKLWRKYEAEAKAIPRRDWRAYLTTHLNLLRKYASYVPSAAYGVAPDISLYDHLRTTSAVAECLRRVREAGGDKEQPFLFVTGDLSGIQGFLYDFRRAATAGEGQDEEQGLHIAKVLRGRSLFLFLLGETVAHFVLRRLDLTSAHILWSGGGRFWVLAPNIHETSEELQRIRRSVDRYLMEEFDGKIALVLARVEASKDDVRKGMSQVWERGAKSLLEEKDRKFRSLMREGLFEPLLGARPCRACGLPAPHEEESRYCSRCRRLGRWGDKVTKADLLLEVWGAPSGTVDDSLDFGDLDIQWQLLEKGEFSRAVRKLEGVEGLDLVIAETINSTDFLPQGWLDLAARTDLPLAFGFTWLPRHTPRAGGATKTFRQISVTEGREGSGYLGFVRIDVDDLGKIFSYGLRDPKRPEADSISRHAALSREVGLFFSGVMETLARGYRQMDLADHADIYLTYSGGDDLFFVARFDHAIGFADTVRREFRRFVADNPSFSLSGGVFVAKPAFPIHRAANRCLALLEGHAKRDFLRLADPGAGYGGKDAITMFGKTLRWRSQDGYRGNLESLLKDARWLRGLVDGGHLARGMLHRILDHYRAAFEGDEFLVGPLAMKDRSAFKPRLFYDLVRNYRWDDGGETPKSVGNRISEFMPWVPVPVSYVLLKIRVEEVK